MPFNVNYEARDLPVWLKEMYERIAQRSRGLSERAYAPYAGARLARFSPQMLRAHELAQQIGIHEPSYNRSEELANLGAQSFTEPGVSERYMNPYENQIVNRIAEEGGRNFREQILPGLEHHFAAHGMHGSSRHRELAQQAARDMQEKVLEAQQAARHRGYETAGRLHASDRARAIEAARQMQDLGINRQAGQLADIEKLQTVGAREQQREQSELDLRHEDYLRHHAFPQQALAEHADIIRGVQAPVHTYQAHQTPPAYEWNKAGQLGHMAAALYGMRQGNQRGGQGYRKGGSIKRASKGFPQMPKIPKLGKAKKLGAQSLTQSSLVRQPKVGGKHTMKKGMF